MLRHLSTSQNSLPESLRQQVELLRGSRLSLRPARLTSIHGQNCFAYRESSIWNSLPSDIKSFRTFGLLQKKLKAMLAEKN